MSHLEKQYKEMLLYNGEVKVLNPTEKYISLHRQGVYCPFAILRYGDG